MSDARLSYDDEIDLFEIFKTLWDEKWIVISFVAAFLAAGSIFVAYKHTMHESKLVYSTQTLPPFYSVEKASADFKHMFYNKDIFHDWKKNNSGTSIQFDDFSNTEVIDSFIITKNKDNLLATFDSENREGNFVLVKSNKLKTLNDFYLYAQHINTLLKNRYVERAKEEATLIESRFKDLSAASDSVVNNILSIDRYIDAATKGEQVLSIARPTMPKKVSPKPTLTLTMAVVLGGMVGTFYALLRSTIRKRKVP